MIVEIEIPNYLREITVSLKRRATYYRPEDKLPKKYNSKDYSFRTVNNVTVLYCNITNEKIIKNTKSVGTPRVLPINGQKIYNGEIRKETRNKLMSEIKESFKNYIKDIDPITIYPLRIEVEIHDTLRTGKSQQLWDVDNRSYPYIKAFQDCLKNHNKIIDDSNLYITRPPAPIFIPIADTNNRKLVFKIYQEDHPVIISWYKDIEEDIRKYKL